MDQSLSARERKELLKLFRNGSAGDFDHAAMSRLFARGLVEIRSKDRRLVLTREGKDYCKALEDGKE